MKVPHEVLALARREFNSRINDINERLRGLAEQKRLIERIKTEIDNYYTVVAELAEYLEESDDRAPSGEFSSKLPVLNKITEREADETS